MPSPIVYTTSTLTAFMEKVQAALVTSSNSAWFRGIGNADDYKLIPNLYRHPTKHLIDECLALERDMLDQFRERSIMFRDRSVLLQDDRELETLVLMQHYGVPTRLMDWSESPFVALYFALTSAILDYSSIPPVYKHNAAVWILNPIKWNFTARGSRPQDNMVFSTRHTALDQYKPQQANNIDGMNMNQQVLSIYGPHNNERVVAQRGTFTLFGRDVVAMEDQFANGGYHLDSLIKLLVPASDIGMLLSQLVAIGVTDSTIFPDLSGIAKELTRRNGFRVSHV